MKPIAIVGEFRAGNPSHLATNAAIAHSAAALGAPVEFRWLGTEELADVEGLKPLAEFGGFWIGPGSPSASMEGAFLSIQEEYRCNYGVNPDYEDMLCLTALPIVGSDVVGVVRAVELAGHPFFVGTLFVPQHTSTASNPNPLVTGFIKACSHESVA